MIQFKSVDEWLSSIKMTRYRLHFEQSGLTNLAAVARLTPQDLAVIGISLVSHQKQLLKSIHSLRAQTSSIISPEGFLV